MTILRGDTKLPFVHPGFVSGDYFPPPFTRITLAASVAAAQFVAYPIFVPHDLSISAMGIYCSAFVSTAACMMGIYTNISHRPGALLAAITTELDLGTSNAWKESALVGGNLALLEGVVYWACVHTKGINATVSCTNNAAGLHNPLLPSTTSVATNTNSGVGAMAVASTYTSGAMLSTAPAVVASAGTNLPIPMLKVA